MKIALVGILLWAAGSTRATAHHLPLDDRTRFALRGSSVPVLLPASLPRSIGPVRKVIAISAGRTGYYVGYSETIDCSGALSCAFIHVSGFPAALRGRRGTHDRPIRLADGTRALFRPRDCSGTGCTEASLTFARAKAVYEVDAKVAGNDLAVLESTYDQLRPIARR